MVPFFIPARMVELVDTLDLKSNGRKAVRVQVPLRVLQKLATGELLYFFYLLSPSNIIIFHSTFLFCYCF